MYASLDFRPYSDTVQPIHPDRGIRSGMKA